MKLAFGLMMTPPMETVSIFHDFDPDSDSQELVIRHHCYDEVRQFHS